MEKVIQIQLNFEESTIKVIKQNLKTTQEDPQALMRSLVPRAIRVYLTLEPFADKDRKITIQSRGKRYRVTLPSIG